MKWEKVRELYPNQFVLLKIIDYHEEDDKRYIDDVAIVKPLNNPKEASRLLVHGNKDDLVYHTNNKQIIVKLKRIKGYRGYI